jgi:hypothetical protein
LGRECALEAAVVALEWRPAAAQAPMPSNHPEIFQTGE